MWIEITVYKTVTQQEASVICCLCVWGTTTTTTTEWMLLFCKERCAVQRYGLLKRKVKFGKNNLLESRYYYYYYYLYYLWLHCTDFSRVLLHFFDIISILIRLMARTLTINK